MRLSVVIPTRNHSADLAECLKSLQKQTKKPFETIVVDGHSTDGTAKVARKYGAKIVYDDLGTIGNAYHVGAKAAKGDFVVFIDDDAVAPKDWLSNMEKALPKADVVGGEDLLKEPATAFQKAGYLTDLAARPKHAVTGKGAWQWLRAACIAYRKKSLSKTNFNPELRGLQEPELHGRMRKAGAKALFDPSIFVYHKRRNSIRAVWKQIYRNGKAKVDLLRLHRSMLSLYDLAPFAFIAVTIASFYSGMPKPWLALIVAYFLVKPLVISAKARGLKFYPLLFAIILTKEAAYCTGIIAGLFSTWGRLKK
jgi:glycosyltransferase involved in cell wall biosynthesis